MSTDSPTGTGAYRLSEETVERALDAAVREHFESRHAVGLCVEFDKIGEASRSVVRRQLRGTVEAALAGAGECARCAALRRHVPDCMLDRCAIDDPNTCPVVHTRCRHDEDICVAPDPSHNAPEDSR